MNIRVSTIGAAAAAVVMAMFATVVVAQEALRIVSPQDGQEFTANSVAQVRWVGGDSSWRMRLSIIDLTRWAVVDNSLLENEDNDGAAALPLPATLICGRTYQFYIEEMGKSVWTYGPKFTVRCQAPSSAPSSGPEPGPMGGPNGPQGPGPGPVPPPPPPRAPQANAPAPNNAYTPPANGEAGKPDNRIKLCGEVHNETYDIRDTVELLIGADGGFTGSVTIGAKLVGSGAFRGTRQGTNCQGATDELTFQGTCTADRFTGRYTIRGQVGTMEASTGACRGGQPARAPAQAPYQAPAQVPPRPAPAPPYQAPAAAPAPAAASKLCGTVHNETYNITETIEMTLTPGAPFAGNLNIGARLYGSGPFQGTRNGANCQASTGDLTFQGTCSATRFSGRYSIRGQVGTMEMSAAGCNGGAQPPPPQAYNPPRPAPPQAAPAPASKLCGMVHNETYNISETVEMTMAPGGGFSGNLSIGARLYGSGPFQGTRNGGQCQATGGPLTFQGTCGPDRFNGRYTINGQSGTMDVSAANCRN